MADWVRFRKRYHKRPSDILFHYGVDGVPVVDILSVLSWMGVSVYYQKGMAASGRLEIQDEKDLIFRNDSLLHI